MDSLSSGLLKRVAFGDVGASRQAQRDRQESIAAGEAASGPLVPVSASTTAFLWRSE